MLIRLENIAKFYPEVDLFADVCLQVNEGDHIGLVGPNGSGKSQLMSIIAGQVAPEAGKVETRSRLRLGKLDQEVRVDPERTVYEEALTVFDDLVRLEAEMAELEGAISHCPDPSEQQTLLGRYSSVKERYERENGYAFRQRTAGVLLGLGLSEADQQLPCRVLSGGQINRLGLARLLLQKPDLLLLDEPTNHLDLKAVRWLEEFLQAWDRAFIVVSHDRYFLDRVVRQIWEINNRRVTSWVGNYTRYQADRHKRVDQQRREFEQQRQLIEKTEDYIRRNIYGQKTRQAQSRRKMLEKLTRLEKPTEDSRRLSLDLSGVPRSSDTVLVLDHLAVGYGAPLVRFPFALTVVRGDRVGLLGENGTGKTTFFRTVLNQLPPVDGTFHWGRNVSVGYFDQKMDSLSSSPLEEMRRLDPLATDGDLRGFLARFGFGEDDVNKSLSTLSGGEKNRLLLARLIYGRHNVLVLDEPTNHLDIGSREELEEALESFPGTLLVITHDRYFLDRIVRKILWIEDGTADSYLGNYSEWESWRQRRAQAEASAEAAAASARKSDSGAAAREEAERRRSAGLSKNERFRLEKQLAELEASIAAAEARQAGIEGQLQEPPAGVSSTELTRLGVEYGAVQKDLERLLAEWEGIGSRLAETPEANGN
jgi:ATP-binding cassette subfamily F protein 3